MIGVVLDSKSIQQLRQARGNVEIRDEDRHLVGYFTPRVARSLTHSVEIPIREDDLKNRLRD